MKEVVEVRFVDVGDEVEALEADLAEKTAARLAAQEAEQEVKLRLRSVRLQQRRYSRGRAGRSAAPRAQAGRHADEALRVMRRTRRPMSQHEVGELAGIGTGTLTHAMQALVADGLAEETGVRKGRSMVFRLTEEGRKSKITRRPPGS